MPANDVYLVTVKGGNEYSTTENIFTYKAGPGSSTASAENLGAIFRSNVIPEMRAILAAEWGCIDMVIKNLFDETDFEQYAFTTAAPGLRSGETLPFFVTLNFKSAKPTLKQDPAKKFMGWLSNSDILGQVVVDNSGYFTVLDDFAEALGASLNGSGGPVYDPVIVKRIKYTTPKGKTAYRLPDDPSESVTFQAINWSYDPFIDHRVTRKIGRGS